MTAQLLRTSERKDFRRCPQRWEWRWVRGLKADREPNALWFGTGMHLAMEAHYRPGKVKKRGGLEVAQATWRAYCEGEWRKVWPEQTSEDEVEGEQALSLGLIMLEGYFSLYGNDQQWEVVATETPFQMRVPFPTSNRTLVWYAGTYDLVVRDLRTGKLWLVDHKNVKTIDTKYLTLDDQGGSYLWAANTIMRHRGILGPTEELEGIIFNFLRKGKPDDRPVNASGMYCNKPTKDDYINRLMQKYPDLTEANLKKMKVDALDDMATNAGMTVLGQVSKIQPGPLFHREAVYRSEQEGVSQAKRVQAEAIVMNKMRKGQLPLYKNPTKDCSWDCSFIELCELDEQGGDTEEFIQGVFQQDNPYASHEEEMKHGGVVDK